MAVLSNITLKELNARDSTTLIVPINSVSEGILHIFIGHWLQFREYFDFNSILEGYNITQDLNRLGLDTNTFIEKTEQVTFIVSRFDILYKEIEALEHEVLDSLREKEKDTAYKVSKKELNDPEMNYPSWLDELELNEFENLKQIYANKKFENKIFRASYEEKIFKKLKTKIVAMQKILINFLQLKVDNGALLLTHQSHSCYLSYYKMKNGNGVEEGATLVFCYNYNDYKLITCYIVNHPATVITKTMENKKKLRVIESIPIKIWFLKDDPNSGFLHTILCNWDDFKTIDGNQLDYNDIMFLRNIYNKKKGCFTLGDDKKQKVEVGTGESNLVNIILFGKEAQVKKDELTAVIKWYHRVRSKLWEAQNLLLEEVKNFNNSNKIEIKTLNNQNNEITTKLTGNRRVFHLYLLKVGDGNTFLVKKIKIGS